MSLVKLNKGAQQTKKPPTRGKYMTNRDKINAMSNAMLADILCRVDSTYNIICKFCIHRGEDCLGKSCFDGIKAWLDAPVKQPTDNKAEKLSVVLDKVL